ncbi:hypothetical protein [Denitratimonas sp. CY0512]|uniref:hypothetical protein n=1 Tax=Denitratimonas sp. CY0512 TaxID=3131940 RepID=UPI0030990071
MFPLFPRLALGVVALVALSGCGLFQPRTVIVERQVEMCSPVASPYTSYGSEIHFQSLAPAVPATADYPPLEQDGQDQNKDELE